MAIVAYVGLPGHGKSYGIVENVIIPALKRKRVVFTNIPMNDEVCLNELGMCVIPFHIDDLIKNPNWFKDVFQAGSIFVIDELWRLWPSGLKATAVREGDKEFLAEHRHLVGSNNFSTEIYFLTQDLSQIAMFARSLVETTYRMVKRSNIGLDSRFRVDIYSGAVTGSKPPASKRERELHGGKFKKEIYRFYKSHTKSETGEAGDESKTDTRANGLKKLSLKLGFVVVIVCCIALYFGFGKVKNQYAPAPSPVPVKQPDKSPAAPQAGSVYAAAPQPRQAPQRQRDTSKFLSSAKVFNISHTIATNANQVTFYKIVFDASEVLLSDRELKGLGYTIVRVNDCLVKVTGYDYTGFIMCAKTGRREPGLMAGLATDMTAAAVPAPKVP
jgi:zona occludens toxin